LWAWADIALVAPLTILFSGIAVLLFLFEYQDVFVVAAMLALSSVLFYPVGYPQYETLPLTLLILAWARSSMCLPAKVGVATYGAFLAVFNVAYCIHGGGLHRDPLWDIVEQGIGLPFFLIKFVLFFLLMRKGEE
jgi:uncharacterized membrane protein